MYCLVDFCFICFNNKEYLQRFSASDNENVTSYIKLTSCVPEMCFNDMNDQRLICITCCEIIDTVYKFRQKCLGSKTTLTDYISQLPKCANASGEVNVYSTDIQKYLDANKARVDASNIDIKKENVQLCQVIDKVDNETSKCRGSIETDNKNEPNTNNFVSSDTRPNYITFEHVEIKKEIENQNSEEHIERSNPFDNQIDFRTDNNHHNVKLTASEIKKENENEDIDRHQNFNNILGPYDIGNRNIGRKSLYLEDCCSDPLMIQDDMNVGTIVSNFAVTSYDVNTQFQVDKDASNRVASFSHANIKEMQTASSSQHMVTQTADKEYECNICQKKYRQACLLAVHMRIHTGERPYECSICKYRFIHASSLSGHMKRHSGEKTHECSVCQKKFGHTSALTTHMRIHTGDKPFECSVCLKRFNHSCALNVHMRIHTGEKPHECIICNQKFRHAGALNTHMVMHTGNMPYECNVCKKKFNQTGHLTIHMRIHTGERPYECDICQKKFRIKGHRTTHMRIHTREMMI